MINCPYGWRSVWRRGLFLLLPQCSPYRIWIHHDLDQNKSLPKHEWMNKSCQLWSWQMPGALVSLQGGTMLACFLSSGCGSVQKQSMLGKKSSTPTLNFSKVPQPLGCLILLKVGVHDNYLLSNNSEWSSWAAIKGTQICINTFITDNRLPCKLNNYVRVLEFSGNSTILQKKKKANRWNPFPVLWTSHVGCTFPPDLLICCRHSCFSSLFLI